MEIMIDRFDVYIYRFKVEPQIFMNRYEKVNEYVIR